MNENAFSNIDHINFGIYSSDENKNVGCPYT